MQHVFEGRVRRRIRWWAAAVTVMGGALVGEARAGSESALTVFASLTSNDVLDGLVVADDEIVVRIAGGGAWTVVPTATMKLFVGDLDADGTMESFADVDALHDRGGVTLAQRLLLSFVSDEHGFLDGDVVGVGPSGYLEVVHPERVFVDAIGALDGDVDVDALHIDADGTIVFSCADDEASSTLSGDQAGVVADGAVLALPPQASQAIVLHTESGVASIASQAFGVAAVITDTKALSRDPATGELLFTVQNPSIHDGSVFTESGALLDGQLEAEFGFAFGGELDALAVSEVAPPGLTVSSELPVPGDILVLYLRGAQPNTAYAVLASSGVGDVVVPGLGWGGLVLAQDPLLSASLSAGLWLVADAAGEATAFTFLPAETPVTDVVLQCVDPAPPRVATNPVLLEIGQ